MNIVFFGSDDFAVPSLKALLNTRHKISCVLTQPDKQKGRGLSLGGTAVKLAAQDSGLKIYQPKQVNANETIDLLNGLNAELFIVISYGQILSQEILDIPDILAINVHASMLPKYRGAAPINWAIMAGEKTTGITVIKMTKDMDAGPIITQQEVEIKDEDTSITLEDRLAKKARELLISSLELIENKTYNLIPQDEKLASVAQKLKKTDGLINWERAAQDIYNLIRGCLGWPGAYTYYSGKILKIHKAKVIRVSEYQGIRVSGKIAQVSKEGIVVACGRDDLIIEELQIEGKRIMKVKEFIAGHKIYAGQILGKKIIA